LSIVSVVLLFFILGFWIRSLGAYDVQMISEERAPVHAAAWMQNIPHFVQVIYSMMTAPGDISHGPSHKPKPTLMDVLFSKRIPFLNAILTTHAFQKLFFVMRKHKTSPGHTSGTFLHTMDFFGRRVTAKCKMELSLRDDYYAILIGDEIPGSKKSFPFQFRIFRRRNHGNLSTPLDF
jgi:hypothetical protein